MNDGLIKRIDRYIAFFESKNADAIVSTLRDCRAALSRKYVPMTDKELKEWYANQPAHDPAISIWFYEKELEAEVIRRAGLEVSND